LASDGALRERLIKAGLDRARACTNEAEQSRLVRFLSFGREGQCTIS
jgi:hypothetical protein